MTLQQREADFLTALSELQLCEQIHQLEQTKKPPYKLITYKTSYSYRYKCQRAKILPICTCCSICLEMSYITAIYDK